MNLQAIEALVEERLVSRQKHPTAELFIYNYTDKAAYHRGEEDIWTDELQQCRGLILDAAGNVVARPFRKFWNYGERTDPEDFPSGSYTVWQKYDGSLGVLYWLDGEPYIATRGSFDSDQARWANRHLQKYRGGAQLDQSITYLFEIIYPDNRIVVDYEGFEGLVLLGGYVTETGEWIDPDPSVGFPVAQTIGTIDDHPAKLLLQAGPNAEGFVLRWPDDYRLKVKFAEYVRLHRLITGLSLKRLWELLKEEGPAALDPFRVGVPQAFLTWLTAAEWNYLTEYARIEAKCKSELDEASKTCLTRKEYAAVLTKCDYPSVLFQMLDERDYSESIWKLLRPEKGHIVFRKENE